MSRFLVLLLSVLLVGVLFTPDSIAQTGRIIGQVVDAEGMPLPGANVRIDNSTLGAASDLDGDFAVRGVPAGAQTLLVTLVGYQRAEREVSVPAGGEVEVTVTLSDDVLGLSGVSVTASRRAEDLSETPRAVAVVQEEVIDLYTEQTSDLSATLGKFVPNFTPPSVGNDVFLATLRGRAPLFLVDGIPLQTNEGLRGAVLGNIDPAVLDRIEVLYGASTIYGGGAPGGVIQFFTKEASEQPLAVDLNLFSRNYLVDGAVLDGDAIDLRSALTVSGTVIDNKLTYVISGSAERTNGQFRPDGERIAPNRTSAYDDFAFFAKVGYNITPSQRVQVSLNRTYAEPNDLFFEPVVREDDVTADPEGSAAIGQEVETAFSYDNPISQEYTALNATYENTALGGGALTVQAYLFDLNFQQSGSDIRPFLQRNGGTFPDSWPGLFQTSTAATQYGARAEYVRPIGEQVVVTGGGDILYAEDSTPVTISSDEPFDRENRFDASLGIQDQGAPSELTSGGLFVQADYDPIEALRLTAGARYDMIAFDILPFTPTFTRVEPGVQRPGGSGYNAGLSLNLGAAYEVVPQTTLYANFAQGFSLPSLAFLVVNVDPGIPIQGDEIVSPQIVNSLDFGVRGQVGDNFAYGVAGFFAFSEDASQIRFNSSTGQGERIQAPQRNYGFEVSVDAVPAAGLRVGADVSVTETDLKPQPPQELIDAGLLDEDDGTFRPASTVETIPLTTTLRASYALPMVDGLSFNAEVYTLNNRTRAFTFLLDEDKNGVTDTTMAGDPSRADAYVLRGYTTVDAGVTYVFPDDLFGDVGARLSVQFLNLLNETYIPAISQRQVGPIFASRRRNGFGRNVTVTLNFTL
ncbi:MAG: TonB-dependent receptor [Bacteroidota bacterium]